MKNLFYRIYPLFIVICLLFSEQTLSAACHGKLCNLKEGFVSLPSRTQEYFVGAPDCETLTETVPAAQIFYRKIGRFDHCKPTIVFIHGFGEISDVWLCAQRALCSEFLTIALDLRGFGQSSLTPASPDPGGIHYTTTLNAEDIFQVLQQLGITKNIILVGHSLGSNYAFRYASLHEEQLKKIVVVGAFPFVVPDCSVNSDCATNCFNPFTCESGFCYPFGITTTAVAGLTQPLVSCLMGGGTGPECLQLWAEFIAPIWYNEPCQAQLASAQQNLVSAVTSSTVSIINNIFTFAVTEDIRPLLPNIDIPVLITFGTIDLAVNPGNSQFLHDTLPKSKIAQFDGKGHQLHVTAFRQFDRLLKKFIKGKRLPDSIEVPDEGCQVCPLL